MVRKDVKVKEVKAKSVLTKSRLAGSDYVINPYSGCAFGCSYCYADFIRRFTGHTSDEWGSYVDVKINAAEILEKELKRLAMKVQGQSLEPTVLIGSVTDPYQGIEAKYQITKKCLEVLSRSNCLASFSILTKSHLVARDINVVKKIRNISVGFTITTTDDEVSRLLEGNSPPVSLRLKALDQLNQEGVSTYVCVNPLLPHFVDNERRLRELFSAIRQSGNREIWLEHINLGGNKLRRIKAVLKKETPKVIKYFEVAKSEKYKADLNRLLFRILRDYDFEIGGGGIIDHKRRVIITNKANSYKKVKSGWRVEVIM